MTTTRRVTTRERRVTTKEKQNNTNEITALRRRYSRYDENQKTTRYNGHDDEDTNVTTNYTTNKVALRRKLRQKNA